MPLTRSNNMARRTAAGVLALSVCLGGAAVALAGSANAAPLAPQLSPAAAADLLSERAVVLATGGAPYDAITAGPFAALSAAPILLNAPGKTLEPAVASYLDAAKAEGDPVTNVYIVGGKDAVSPDVEAALLARGVFVDRIGGADRYATARNVADAVDHLLMQ